MAYTVWMDGAKIGETNLELRHGAKRRAGIFHPTEFGLTVLPGITAMTPALLDTGRTCQEQGIDTEDENLDIDRVIDDVFGSAAGQRVLAAAKEIARLEVRSPSGELMPWKSILISDMNELAAMTDKETADKDAGDPSMPILGDLPPIRYFISATFKNASFAARLRARGQRMS
jgi:hypothetical protein